MTRAGKRAQLAEVLSVFIEDLHSGVVTIRNIDPPLTVDGDSVYHLELAVARPEGSPCLQVFPVLVELDDAGIFIAVSNEKRALGQERNIGRHVEVTVVSARMPKEPAQRHDELLAVSCEFVDLMHVPVDDPDV